MKTTGSSLRLRRLAAFALAGAALLGAAPLPAEDVPPRLGPEFPVNTFTSGSQHSPDVARYPDGRFVVVWQDDGDPPQGVKARLYEASGAPAGGELRLTDAGPIVSPPRVAALPGGGFAVVWADFNDVELRRFDREGQPLGDAAVVNVPGALPNVLPDVAADAAGNLAVVWVWPSILSSPVLLRRFDAAGDPQGEPVQVNAFPSRDLTSPRVAMNDAGSLLVSWDAGLAGVRARRYDGPTGTWSNEVKLAAPFGGHSAQSAPVLYPAGDGAVVFGDLRFVDVGVFAQRLDDAGAPVGDASEIGGPLFEGGGLDAALDAAGDAFVVWSARQGNAGTRIHGRLLDRAWQPLGDEVAVSTGDGMLRDWEPAVAADAAGGFAAVWSDDGGPFLFFPFIVLPGKDGSQSGVFGQLFGDPECAADSEILCLGQGNRFHVKVSWKTPSEEGTGHAHPLTADTGAFWFFGPDNLELMIKVLDGRAVNGHFWVFYGALSNVDYTLTVTDTATGNEKTYHNPAGRLASQADTGAFADAGSSATASLASPLPAAATACPIFLIDTTLCLNSGRFFVEVTFTDPRNGAPGPGHALGLTADTGAFWFFDPNNLELMVKVLDGRAVNGHWWVFFGALSNVAYTIRVTDTETGEQRTYVNPRGQLASRADTAAFPVGH